MPSHSGLPLNAYDRILDILAEDTAEEQSLRACLFVSRFFRHRVRTSLFRTIRIDDVGTQFRTQRSHTAEKIHRRLRILVDLVRPPSMVKNKFDVTPESRQSIHSLGILPYIREVYFTFSMSGSIYFNNHGQSKAYGQSQKHAHQFLNLLNAPTCMLQSLSIDGSGDMGYGSWSTLSPAIRSSLLDLCRAPTLSTLHLIYMTDVPENILEKMMVTDLTTYGVKCSPPQA